MGSKREIKIKKTTSPKTPPTKKNQPAIHGLRKPGSQARKQKTMRSTKLGTKNKPISFKIDFENFFAKTKIDRPPFISPPPYTKKKKKKTPPPPPPPPPPPKKKKKKKKKKS